MFKLIKMHPLSAEGTPRIVWVSGSLMRGVGGRKDHDEQRESIKESMTSVAFFLLQAVSFLSRMSSGNLLSNYLGQKQQSLHLAIPPLIWWCPCLHSSSDWTSCSLLHFSCQQQRSWQLLGPKTLQQGEF